MSIIVSNSQHALIYSPMLSALTNRLSPTALPHDTLLSGIDISGKILPSQTIPTLCIVPVPELSLITQDSSFLRILATLGELTCRKRMFFHQH